MDYPTGHIPEELKNFKDVNSGHDDYNSDLNMIGADYFIQFSTNRYSGGKQYDLMRFKGSFRWDQDRGSYSESWGGLGQWSLYDSTITPANELGPFTRQFQVGDQSKYFPLYASDEKGNYDINFTYTSEYASPNGSNPASSSPEGIAFINTPANELYPSFLIRGEQDRIASPYIEKMFYCSDKSGNFDIYQIDFPGDENILSFLTSKVLRPSTAVDALNSAYEDKCPFFANNRLVFASNRPGGFGGFDLYYAVYENGQFSPPVNFGETINTAFDEYRPIIEAPAQFDNEFIIFSSNRPGGKGGYDLYYTGIPKVD